MVIIAHLRHSVQTHYVYCYPSWQEVAGMEVVIEKDVVITPQELVAGLLWEITYFGGTEEIAQKNMDRTFRGGTK